MLREETIVLVSSNFLMELSKVSRMVLKLQVQISQPNSFCAACLASYAVQDRVIFYEIRPCVSLDNECVRPSVTRNFTAMVENILILTFSFFSCSLLNVQR